LARDIIAKDTASLVFGGLYCFGSYFAGTYIAANAEKIARLIAFGREPYRYVVSFFRIVGLYFIVSGVLLIAIMLISLIALSFFTR
jgi:hypothetical protein